MTGPDRDQAAPDEASRIRFVLDGVSCRGTVALDVLIDKKREERSLVGGDSVEYRTSAGLHAVSVRAAPEGLTVFGEWLSLQVEAPVRVVMTC
ncbi:MAG TPA: hypothetical protein VIP11_22520 [Gemmatimonadaceae bacterium]